MSDKTIRVIYVFNGGPGEAGIPGLPHEISMSEAAQTGVLDLLKEAIKAKKYVVKADKQPKEGE